LTLTVVASALLGAYVGQVTLNEHGRNLSLAIQDANRIIEQIRQENTGCPSPEAIPAGATSWDVWLEAQAPGKSLAIPNPNVEELIVVTCSHSDGPAAGLCGNGNQVGTGEWTSLAGNTSRDPLRITVAVCWRHRGRTIGECAWDGANLSANDANGSGVIDSPAMLTTLVTCR
jgi:hypothetical protein